MSLDERLAALARAAELGEGRLDGDLVSAARAVVGKAGVRLGLGVEATVVALAGPTGAGKSTLFNAIAGRELAAAGRRRPTTASAVAAVWGDVPTALLDWVDVRVRHRLDDGGFDRLALLDLPDFDSVEAAHRLEVDRLVELVDLVVWVVDPQKYADNVWHERYLRRLAGHGGSMAVVLNQADLLRANELAACRLDLARLVERDGAEAVPIVAVSALTGDGLPDLTRLLRERVEAREAVAARLAADVEAAAAALAVACGEGAHGASRSDRTRLFDALADAAGVATVQAAVAKAHRRRGALATGWPYLRWLRRLRPDPLRRLHLGDEPAEHVRTSLPPASEAQVARAENASRELARNVASRLPEPWPRLVREAATPDRAVLAAELDRAVAGADLHVRPPLWWRLVRPLQTLLGAAVAVGLLWLLALFLLDYLRLGDVVPTPEVRGLPLPTALLLGAAAAGIALAFLSRLVNGAAARRRARAAARSVRRRVEATGEQLVLAPVEAELAAYRDFCAALSEARRGERAGRRRRRAATSPA
ncbi:MAG TPA: GTPase [Gaiellaceae bacterium]|nr:GTPase [Gaiellaceae bacterium]